jgi:glycosyltransferase involved in cell wall biosynthesis
MELPVVSSAMSGIPEMVEHGVSGLLLPPKNERALAVALKELMGDRALRRRLGQNARKRVEAQFDIQKNILAYIELFEGRAADGPAAQTARAAEVRTPTGKGYFQFEHRRDDH